MYTHNPPEQFSLVTRAESTCVERCEPTKFEHPLPLRLKHIQVRVKGRAHVLSTSAEIGEAERVHLRPWTATQKLRYVRVNASEVTGRRFKFGPEPDHAVVYD